MQTSKQLTIDLLLSYRYPLAAVRLLQEIRRVQAKNSGPSLHEKNICEVAETSSEELFDFIKHIGYFRFGDETEILGRSGRFTLTRANYNYIYKYISKVFKYQSELNSLDDENLKRLFDQTSQARAAVSKVRQNNDDKFAFFNSKTAEARFDYWLRLPSWTADEAIALSLGKDPRAVNQEKLQAFDRFRESPFCIQYCERLDLIKRASDVKVISETLSPAAFILWFGTNDIPLPPAMHAYREDADEVLTLRAECDRLRGELETRNKRDSDEILGRPKRITLLKVIIGMAVARFEHRTEKSSGAAGLIEKSLQNICDSDENTDHIKISVSDDVIRNILSEAARELDFRWANEISWRGTRRL